MESQLVKDKAKLAVASIKGAQSQDLYVAVTKATLAEEVPPKEKHVRTLKIACSAHAPRPQVDFVIYKLSKRLSNPHWLVALKALMTFHRLMRECDPSFQEQLLRFCDRTGRHRMLCLDRYADHTSRETWDYSAWIRAYGVFLDERLDAFRAMGFDPESSTHAARQQQQGRTSYSGATGGGYGYGGPTGGYGGPTGGYGGPTGGYGGPTGGYGGPTGYGGGYGGPTGGYGGPTGAYGGATGAYGGATGAYGNGTGATASPRAGGAPAAGQIVSLKDCSAPELLERLPRMQRLMLRMLDCVPNGAAAYNQLCLLAAHWVLRESKAVYRSASEGVINLADKFFEMERSDAVRGLELYRDALSLHEKLTGYYNTMQAIPALKTAINYPALQPLPADFVATMEEYVKHAPRDGTAAARAAAPPPPPPPVEEEEEAAEEEQPAEEAPAEEEAAPEPEPEPEQPPSPPKGSPVKAALMPVIDLLSFEDEPAAEPSPAPRPEPKGELDFLADGMGPQANGQQAGGGFEPGAFEQQQGQQQQQQPGPYGQPPPYSGYDPAMGGYGGYPGYAPQMTGYPGYPPQMTGYGYPPQMTGAPTSMALVPVGPMGMNPFMMGGAFGMPPPAAPPAPYGSNPHNPFNDGGAAAGGSGGGTFVGQRLENDPLNALTDELLGARPKPKGFEPAAGPSPSLRELKVAKPGPQVVANSATAPPATQ